MKALIFTGIALLTCLFTHAQTDSTLLFESSKGNWNFPVSNYTQVEKFGNIVKQGRTYNSQCTSLISDTALTVSAVYSGKVVVVTKIEDFHVIIVKFGDYYVTYSGLTKPIVRSKEYIVKGQTLAQTEKDFDSKYRVNIFFSKGKENLDAFEWFTPEALLASGIN